LEDAIIYNAKAFYVWLKLKTHQCYPLFSSGSFGKIASGEKYFANYCL